LARGSASDRPLRAVRVQRIEKNGHASQRALAALCRGFRFLPRGHGCRVLQAQPLRSLEGKMSAKRAEHSLPESAVEIFRAQLVWRSAGKQEPLKVVAFHVLDG